MRRLAVERGVLLRVLAVGKVAHLLDDDREAVGELRAGDVVEVAGHLGEVRGNVGQRVGGEALTELGRDAAHLAQLAHELRVVAWRRNCRDRRVVARGGGDERGSADVDQLDRLVQRHGSRTDLRREGLDVDDDEVDQPDALLGQLLELVGRASTSEDAGVDLRIERLDLAAGEWLAVGQAADRLHLDTGLGERRARSVGREELYAMGCKVAREFGYPVAVSDREQGSHQFPPVPLGGPARSSIGHERGTAGRV